MWPYIILGIIVLAIVITAIKAVFYVPKKKDFGTPSEEKVDAKRAQDNLSKAISIPTISYPEKDKIDFSQFEKFHKFLEETYPLIHKTLKKEVVQEASLIFHWKGKRDDLEPIALLAHQDVVPISAGTEQDWTYAPFSGHNDGEFIWGRGALDMKNHLVGVMDAVETLLEEGFEPERDVYLLFGQDEEVVASEDGGAKNIMKTLKDRGIHLDSVLDEGGAIIPVNIKGILNNKELIGVGVAEKGYTDFEITVNAKGGHSSQPPLHSGLGELANVIKDLEDHQFKAELLPFVKNLFSNLGRSCTYPARLLMCNLNILHPLLKFGMTKIPFTACLVRTTTAVTMAQGSPAANVLPQKSSIVVNFRQMPGTSVKDVEAHIRKVCRNKDIEVKVLKAKEASKFSSTESRAFKIIEELCMQENKDSVVAPYLVMGGTDACYYEPICENIYRYAPYKVSVALLRCTHGTDERIPVDAVAPAVAFFKRYIRKASAE